MFLFHRKKKKQSLKAEKKESKFVHLRKFFFFFLVCRKEDSKDGAIVPISCEIFFNHVTSCCNSASDWLWAEPNNKHQPIRGRQVGLFRRFKDFKGFRTTWKQQSSMLQNAVTFSWFSGLSAALHLGFGFHWENWESWENRPLGSGITNRVTAMVTRCPFVSVKTLSPPAETSREQPSKKIRADKRRRGRRGQQTVPGSHGNGRLVQ